mgnify:FL=1|jgi:hypothetical protein|tara:strand:- start:15 stop:299 length:285 start_codon:yes stop_codon:yes gene_type:complete
METQLFLNVLFGIISFLGGWLMKMLMSQISELKNKQEKLMIKHIDDMEDVLEKHTNLALSMPEKYVSKDDFQSFVERIDHRFNRLEEKLDALKK